MIVSLVTVVRTPDPYRDGTGSYITVWHRKVMHRNGLPLWAPWFQEGQLDGSPEQVRFSQERTMIWSEQEACVKQVTQISTSACGATAAINVLVKLFHICLFVCYRFLSFLSFNWNYNYLTLYVPHTSFGVTARKTLRLFLDHSYNWLLRGTSIMSVVISLANCCSYHNEYWILTINSSEKTISVHHSLWETAFYCCHHLYIFVTTCTTIWMLTYLMSEYQVLAFHT